MRAVAPTVFAHAGFHYVMGTVAKVSGNVLTVKTAKGYVDVKLSEKTELTRQDRKAQIADLKSGTRVVAEVPEEGRDNVAQSVRIGAAPRAAAARHSPGLPQIASRHTIPAYTFWGHSDVQRFRTGTALLFDNCRA